jgi:stearoyl-CoA desaturase (delta-9 desaturase)
MTQPVHPTELVALKHDATPVVDPNVKLPLDRSHVPVAPLWQRLANFIAVVVPFIALFVAAAFLWGRGFSWVHLGVLFGMYMITAIGITVGFHRLFTHQAFKTNPVVKGALAIMGMMAVEGPLLRWTATHRRHHQHSDEEDDPHSPHHHGGGVVGTIKGFWHAHMGWLLRDAEPEDLARYNPDLRRDKLLAVLSNLWWVWALLGLLIPAAVAGLITMSWMDVFLGFLWGGLVRIFLVHHVTWSINSVCHIWGSRPFKSNDESRNNWFFGILGLGEGWHNNHHAFPTSARHGLKWWQIDFSYLFIKALSKLGLAWDVKVPSKERLAKKVRTA